MITSISKDKSIHFCVIVPTYNNHKTLKRVLDSVLEYTSNVIVVNDGSTDSTFEIVKGYQNVAQVHHPKNVGKGMALRNGFKKAIELNYDYAITIDSDGQHFASDIPLFVQEIKTNGEALLIGSRNMTTENVPKKVVLEINFLIFGFGLKQEISFQTHNLALDYIL